MIYTTTLMSSRGGLIGSLINKVRQVVAKDWPPSDPSRANDTDHRPLTPPRPLAAASISNTPAVPSKTLEEQLGLPPRPKKPLTPYFRFMREQRPKLKAANPQITTVEVVRQLSKNWSDADAQLKERLQAEFKRDQQIYVEERTKYDATLTEEQRAEIKQLKQDLVDAKERRQLRKRVKELGRPKKPASAFLRFIASERINTPQGDKQTYREWHQKTTAKWTRLSDSEKEVYMQESRKEMELYRKAISVWEEKMIRLGHIDVVRHGNLIDPPEPKPRKTLASKDI
uniref:Mitochondrial transcription factor A, isoform B n=1 Tax=Drosophila melanogaster TaxID=7227 RepID=Q86BR8_DROME|nr:mitochondrial transcription factor A, isoform B [Drosophila melanogaster]AAF55779.2 mitochondrial transcription factor A, isoform B [Drosophila melanogaster]|eukprot:NP_732527.1 mitochondrial transcription factor A, isoform B [Drosophila melanogaster]